MNANTQLSFAFTALLVAGGLLLLVAIFLFGRAVLDTVLGVFRLVGNGIAGALRLLASSILAIGWYFVGVFMIVALAGAGIAYVYWFKPGAFELARLKPAVCTELLDRKGAVLDYYCPLEGVRIWRPLDAYATSLRMIVVMLEDDKFYEHGGLDIDEIWNALETDIEKGKLARGGSTITQQLAKNLFLTKEKSILRKASEVPLAMRLERELSKDQILELYLNTIEWGPGIFGAEAAARLYFDHEASALTDEESWLLALMIPNPKELNLWVAPRAKKSLVKRARRLATRLWQEHRMSKDEAEAAFDKFTSFLDRWATAKPLALRGGRKYPARWQNDRTFSVAEVVSVRRGATGIARKLNHAPLRLHLDREIQEKLEALQPKVHAHDLSEMLVLMDGGEIRAMIPLVSRALVEAAKPLAADTGLVTQVYPARNIPAGAIWP